MDWSLILPTRERVGLLDGLLTSLAENTEDMANVEVLVAVDQDDAATLNALHTFEERFRFARFLIGPRQKNFSVGYYNRMAHLSTGRYVQALNDDCRFVTRGWDRWGREAFEAYRKVHPDGFAYGKCDDGLGQLYACFPTLTREALDVVGWVFHPEFTAWGADIHIHRIYSALDRVVDLPYKVEHICHHTGTRERDHVNRRMATLSRYNYGSAPGETLRIRKLLAEAAGKT